MTSTPSSESLTASRPNVTALYKFLTRLLILQHDAKMLTSEFRRIKVGVTKLHYIHEFKQNKNQLVEYRTRNQEVAGSTYTRSTASNLEQVANLLCA